MHTGSLGANKNTIRVAWSQQKWTLARLVSTKIHTLARLVPTKMHTGSVGVNKNKYTGSLGVNKNTHWIATDLELKGRWAEPPAAKRRFFGELE